MNPTSSESNLQRKERVVWLWPAVVLMAVAVILGTVLFVRALSGQSVTAAAPATVTITTDGFSPATITVHKGQDVTWINQDARPHGLVADSSAAASLNTDESLNTGDTFTASFDQTGTYTYHDATLPTIIKGTVIVK